MFDLTFQNISIALLISLVIILTFCSLMAWSDIRKIKIVMEDINDILFQHIAHSPHQTMHPVHSQTPYMPQMHTHQSRQQVPIDIRQVTTSESSSVVNNNQKLYADDTPKTSSIHGVESDRLLRPDSEAPKLRRISPPKNHSLKFESRSPHTDVSHDTSSDIMEKELENELRELDLDDELGELDAEVAENENKIPESEKTPKRRRRRARPKLPNDGVANRPRQPEGRPKAPLKNEC